MDYSNNFSGSSSLCIAERMCTALFPFAALIEVLIYAVANCFDCRPRFKKNTCRISDLARLAHESRFTVSEIEALFELYKKLSNSNDGLIHKEELQSALFETPYGENLILDRVFDLFDEKKKGAIEFEEFIHALNVFHPCAPVEEKIDFAFRLYDLRQTGFIEREEVRQMVIAIFLESDVELPDQLLDDIIDRAFDEADADRDGRISRDEWKAFAIKHPSLLKNMTLPYLKDISTAFPSFIFNTEVED